MLRYLNHAAIDTEKWDACLHRAANGMIYGFSWYLDIVSPGWEGIVKEEAGEYLAIMPVPIARKFGFKYVRQPVFAQQLGVFTQTPITEQEWETIQHLLLSEVKLISKYNFNTENHGDKYLTKFNQANYTNYHLSLKDGYAHVVGQYRKDRRWRINKAKRSSLEIQPTENLELFLSMFHEHVAPKIPGVIGEAYEYKMFRQIFREATARGLCSMFMAVNAQGQAQAMGVFLFFNRKIIFLLSCSTPEGKAKGSISLLVDFVLQKYAGQDVVFDFESPQVEQLADFYSSFGSQGVPFLSVSVNRLPAPVQWLKKLRMQWYQRHQKAGS